jgi:hypothetical protein
VRPYLELDLPHLEDGQRNEPNWQANVCITFNMPLH